jgi:hypothetical protein
MTSIKPIGLAELKSKVLKVATTSHYLVNFSGLPAGLQAYMLSKGLGADCASLVGLMCFDTSIPGTQLTTKEVEGNFTGVTETFATTRQFNDLSMTFYVDLDYRVVKFFETWMSWISGQDGVAGQNSSVESRDSPAYFYRMRYPNQYKCNGITISKFDKDYSMGAQYRFVRMYPVNVAAVPISYDQSQLLRLNVTFKYERYIPGYNIYANTSFKSGSEKYSSNLSEQEVQQLNSIQSGLQRGDDREALSGLFNPTNTTASLNEFVQSLTDKSLISSTLEGWTGEADATRNPFVNFVGRVADRSLGGGDAFDANLAQNSRAGRETRGKLPITGSSIANDKVNATQVQPGSIKSPPTS